MDEDLERTPEDEDDAVAHAPPTPTRRSAQGAVGGALSAAMIGLGDVLEPSKKREEPAIVVDWAGDPLSDDPMAMRLDPENPADSIVMIRRPRELSEEPGAPDA